MFSTKLCVVVFILVSSLGLQAQEASYIKNLLPDISQNQPSETQDSSMMLKQIFVKGNKSLTTEEIISKSKLLIGSPINELLINRAKRNIKLLGVVKNVDIILEESTGSVSIFIDEFPVVTTINFQGNSIYTYSFLSTFLHSKTNAPLNLNHIRQDIQFIEDQYKKDGYIEAKVIRIEKPNANDGSLTFVIAEGVIDDIQITGNIKTQDYVILREIDIRPGDIINENDIRDSIRKVFNLNYFINIVPDLIPSSEDYHYIFKLTIEEKETSGAFTFGGGYQPNSGFNLFSDLYWDNLKGTGQLIMVKGNFGLGAGGYDNQNNTYQIKFHNPWAFGKRKSFTFRLWSSSGSFSLFNAANSNYSFNDVDRRGFDMEFGIPLSYDLRTSHRLKYESVILNDQNSHYHLYTYRFFASIDKRDQLQNPTQGYYHTFSAEQGFKFKPSAIDMSKIDLSFRKYFPIFKKQVLFFKSTFGYFRSPSTSSSDIDLDEYYYVGGSRTVRGYNDGSPFAYGNKQVLGTFEYRYIFTHSFSSYFFIDAGYATLYKVSEGSYESKNYYDLSEYKLTKGIGFKFVIPPIGPIRIDHGFTDNNPNGRTQINLGYSF